MVIGQNFSHFLFSDTVLQTFLFLSSKIQCFLSNHMLFHKKKDGKPLLDKIERFFSFTKIYKCLVYLFFIWLMQDIIYEKINFTCLVWLVIAERSKFSTKSLLPLGTLLLCHESIVRFNLSVRLQSFNTVEWN